MSFTIHPLSPSDAPGCVTIYFSAFQNAHSLACWPRVPSVRAFWETMTADEIAEPGAHWFKAVATATGETAGFAKWVQPRPGVEPSEDLPAWPAEADSRLCDETFGEWARWHRKLMGARGHWYLEIVATDPRYQGQGIGTALIGWGLQRADANGVEAYLEASPEAVRLYEKLGFREVGRTDTWIDNERVQPTWYRNLFMIRPPQGKELE